jgi:hypothetical protein
MANHAILNNIDHKDLRIDIGHSAGLGDAVMCTLAIPSEFRNLQAEYPIFFHQNVDTGKFSPMVIFGLNEEENLYLSDGRWDASYIPLMIERGPFLIGFQAGSKNDLENKKMVISIDMDNPRVNCPEGEAVFQPFGGNSEYTEHVISVLQEIDQGQEIVEELIEALVKYELIEPFRLEIEFDNGSRQNLEGFHTIHEEKLAALEGEVLADFNQRGILQAIFMIIASMSNVRRLIDLKNGRL